MITDLTLYLIVAPLALLALGGLAYWWTGRSGQSGSR